MSKFIERLLFFVFTPISIIWAIINAQNCISCTYDTEGGVIGIIVAVLIVISIPLGIGFYVRNKRIKMEYKTHAIQ